MRTVGVLLVVLATLSVGAVVASAAEWLVDGEAVTAKVATETLAELLLEDNNAPIGKAAVLCGVVPMGPVEAGGKGSVTEILSLKEFAIGELGGVALKGTGAGSECVAVAGCAEGTVAHPIEVWPVALPWTTTLEKVGGKILEFFTAAKEFGFEILCFVLGIAVEDSCLYAKADVEVTNDAGGDSEIPAELTLSPLAKCSMGGANSGVVETDTLATIRTEMDLTLLSVNM